MPTKPKRPPSVVVSTLLLGFFSLIWLVGIIALPTRVMNLFSLHKQAWFGPHFWAWCFGPERM